MVESVREIVVTIMIDTNKRTIRKEFNSLEEAKEWIEEYLEDES